MSDLTPEQVDAKIASLIPKYGARSSWIPGSTMMRDYCHVCGDPIRVDARSPRQPTCYTCDMKHPPHPPGSSPPIDDVTGYQANAIRALEDWR